MKYAQLNVLDDKSKSADAKELCADLNRMLPVELLINAILTSAALAFGFWTVLTISFFLLIRVVIKISDGRENKMGYYDPGEMTNDNSKFNDLKKICRWQLFIAFIFLYLYSIKSVSFNYDLIVSC